MWRHKSFKLFFDGLLLSIELMLHGLLLTCLIILPQFAVRFRGKLRCDEIDVTGKLCQEGMVCKMEYQDMFSTFVCHQFRLRMGVDNFALFVVFVGSIFWTYLKLTWRQILIMFVMQCTAYYLVIGGLFLNRDPTISSYTVYATPVTFLLPYLFFKFYLRVRDGFIPRLTLKLLIVTTIAAMLLKIYDRFVGQELWFVLVVYPCFKVIMCAFARSNSKEMVTHQPQPGQVEVRREYAMIFVLILQIFFATLYRMVIASIDANSDFAIFMVFSTLQEIWLRVTFPMQDDMFKKLTRKLCFWKNSNDEPKRSAIVAPVSGAVLVNNATGLVENEKKVKVEWIAMMLSVEMVSEYIGMFVATAMAIMFMNERFSLPLPIYYEQELGEPFNIVGLISKLGVQLIGELLVDAFCLAVEEVKYNYPLREGWKAQRWIPTIITYTVSGYVGLSITILFLHNGSWGSSHTRPCENTNVCSCYPPPFNVYGRVCGILYPNGYDNRTVNMLDPLFDDL